jgi:hypothetical protein
MPKLLSLSEVQTLATAQHLGQHRSKSVAATRAELQRTLERRRELENDRRYAEGERRREAYIATREASMIAELAGDRASSTKISCARKVADCG